MTVTDSAQPEGRRPEHWDCALPIPHDGPCVPAAQPPARSAQDIRPAVTRPGTEAGRQLWHGLTIMVRGIRPDELAHDILAIEAEARRDSAGLPDDHHWRRLTEQAVSIIEAAGRAAFILPWWSRRADAWLERARGRLSGSEGERDGVKSHAAWCWLPSDHAGLCEGDQ